ncbi:beta-ketoacyl-[acyl-carrier-protein] synthase family protein [Salinispora oceanensis]|uniref:hypothetical protein n=1 Tax=Salinispora oceanensis TaxID=1050199 RepID=UPI00035F8892|nr:hypothetical protein [Salinispora oceanensis]
MTTDPTLLCAPRYILGEFTEDHSLVRHLYRRAEELRMPLKPELWGWGSIHRSERGLDDLAVESAATTLAAAAVVPSTVDAIVLACTRFPGGPETHGGLVRSILTRLRLDHAAFFGVTLNRCTNMLAALQLADALVRAGAYRRVLVVTTDRVADEATRMESFALFSDGAASCLVASTPVGNECYAMLGCATAQDAESLDWGNEINAGLAREVNHALLTPHGLTANDLHGLFHTNVYKPIAVLKEAQAGFRLDQLWTDNIARVGHCFAADPLINLSDRAAAGGLVDGGLYQLAASVPGSRIGVLIQKLTA